MEPSRQEQEQEQEKVDVAVREYLRRIGSRGGKQRAKMHSAEQLSEWARLGGRRPKRKAA